MEKFKKVLFLSGNIMKTKNHYFKLMTLSISIFLLIVLSMNLISADELIKTVTLNANNPNHVVQSDSIRVLGWRSYDSNSVKLNSESVNQVLNPINLEKGTYKVVIKNGAWSQWDNNIGNSTGYGGGIGLVWTDWANVVYNDKTNGLSIQKFGVTTFYSTQLAAENAAKGKSFTFNHEGGNAYLFLDDKPIDDNRGSMTLEIYEVDEDNDDVCELIDGEYGWLGTYYNYPRNHPDMALPFEVLDNEVITNPLASDFNRDWYTNEDYFRFNQVDSNLEFGEDFFPFDGARTEEIEPYWNHDYHFGVHWASKLTVDESKNYNFKIISDDDSWVYINGELVIENGRVHTPEILKGNSYYFEKNKEYIIEVYYAERHVARSHMNFYFEDDNGITLKPYSDDCEEEVIDLTPKIYIYAMPTSGVVPLKVNFFSQGVGGNGDLSYHWDFDDGSSSNSKNVVHTYNQPGTYEATATVTDEDGDKDSKSVVIKVAPKVITITDITCFDNVIENNNQSCSVTVENSLGLPEPNVNVKIYYSDGSEFGSCVTDSISGACETKDLQKNPGDYEVYAIATKTGYVNDVDTYPRFSYTVFEEKYEIIGLKVYNDKNFENEDYDFYRGENMYVKFSVEKNGVLAEDIVTEAALVSGPGGRVELNEIRNEGGKYFYELKPIPTTHGFLGDSQVFAFAFNFEDKSGGQEQVNLIIRNNKPVIVGKIKDVRLDMGETVIIDLSEFESDVEDSGDALRWEVKSSDNVYFDTNVVGKNLFIIGKKDGKDIIKLRLIDLDKDYDETSFNVFVNVEDDEGNRDKPRGESRTGDSHEVNNYYSGWSECVNGMQTRTYYDLYSEEQGFNTEIEVRACELTKNIVEDSKVKGNGFPWLLLLIIGVVALLILVFLIGLIKG